jgi:hypothetical protein
MEGFSCLRSGLGAAASSFFYFQYLMFVEQYTSTPSPMHLGHKLCWQPNEQCAGIAVLSFHIPGPLTHSLQLPHSV